MQGDTSGVVVIDKPADITSARVVDALKRVLNVKKAGHSGTLDPFATGVLVCCLNQATRLSRFFLHGEKVYRAVLHLGVDTDTQDSTGTVIATSDDSFFSEDTIRSVIMRFEGASWQQPPVISALKHKGTPLYKLARMGTPVQKPAREIFISSIDILKINLPFIWFEVRCSAGTYIRTLCTDIGKTLGCGGHLKELRRIKSSGFSIDEALSFSDLGKYGNAGEIENRIIGMSDALRGLPSYMAETGLVEKIRYGQRISGIDFRAGFVRETPGFVKIVDENNRLCAVLEVNDRIGQYRYCCVFN